VNIIFQSGSDFSFSIAIKIPIEKPIRIDHDPVFIFQSFFDFFGKTGLDFFF